MRTGIYHFIDSIGTGSAVGLPALAMVGGVLLAAPRAEAIAGSCGSPPRTAAPACNYWKCTADGWVAWPLAADTPCSQGYCDGGVIVRQLEPQALGSCIAGATFTPAFHVQSILYAPPGNMSYVEYGSGSLEGSGVRIETRDTVAASTSIRLGSIGVGGSYAVGFIDGSAVSVTKSDNTTLYEYVESGVDHPIRGGDTFRILVNSQQTRWLSSQNGWERIDFSTVMGAQPNVLYFSADEISGAKPLTCNSADSERCAFLRGLDSGSRQSILSLDEPLNAIDPESDPQRYQRIDLQGPAQYVLGPDQDGSVVAPANGIFEAYNTQNDTYNGSYVNVSGTVLARVSVPMTNITLGGSATWTHSFMETRQSITGSQKSAYAFLRSSTVRCVMKVRVYIDASFGTFLVLPDLDPSNTAGCT